MSASEAHLVDPSSSDEMAKRKTALIALLAEHRPKFVWRLFGFASMVVAITGANLSQLPLITKIALGAGAYFGPVAAIEVWWLRRRFEAALELLGLLKQDV